MEAVKNPRQVARHSRYDQVSYRDRQGMRRVGRLTEESCKLALLAVGTAGRFTVYEARTGIPYSVTWPLGIAYFANLKRGYYYA